MTEYGWTHEEAKLHTVVERLFERCAAYSPRGRTCFDDIEVPVTEWCERCLAASRLLELGDS